MREFEVEKLLTPAEVGAIFRCDSKTVSRWAKQGKLTSYRTPGGHRRYKEAEVLALLRRPEPTALDAPVTSLWPAIVTGPDAAARKKLAAGQVDTVGKLADKSATDLAAIGIKGEALAAVRLVLAKRGLALHGEVLGKVALARPSRPRSLPTAQRGRDGESR